MPLIGGLVEQEGEEVGEVEDEGVPEGRAAVGGVGGCGAGIDGAAVANPEKSFQPLLPPFA